MIKSEYYESGLFKDAFREMTKGLEDHQFRHYNHAMGVMIESREQYLYEMKRRGMVPFQETERLADLWDKAHPQKAYDHLTPKAGEIIRSLKLTADKHGNIKLGGRAIKALIEIGAIKPRNKLIPDGYEYIK